MDNVNRIQQSESVSWTMLTEFNSQRAFRGHCEQNSVVRERFVDNVNRIQWSESVSWTMLTKCNGQRTFRVTQNGKQFIERFASPGSELNDQRAFCVSVPPVMVRQRVLRVRGNVQAMLFNYNLPQLRKCTLKQTVSTDIQHNNTPKYNFVDTAGKRV